MGPSLPFSEQVHAEKYRGKGESFKEAMNRIAGTLEDSDPHFRAFRDILLDMRFLPGGRIQTAIGSTKTVTAYNCFVSGAIADSFVDGEQSIMDIAAEAAATMRMGGGIGYNFGSLRPRGDYIRKLGSKSSGPVSFMEIYDAICRCVSSSGHRRGAQMGVMPVDHPDIEEFIHSKQPPKEAHPVMDKLAEYQPGTPEWLVWYSVLQLMYKLTGFNISVAITDRFMDAVASGGDFALRFEDRVYRYVDARTLWDQIMRSTWDWAEPGVLFMGTINRMNNLSYCERIIATNPCFTGDTRVWTAEFGHVPFSQLAGHDVDVLTQTEDGRLVYRRMRNIGITQKKTQLVRITLDNGESIRCTPGHKFFLRDGRKVAAGRLAPGDSLCSVYRYRANQKGYLRLTNGFHDPLEHHVPFEHLGSHEHVHHANGLKWDNRPSNLDCMDGSAHNSTHMQGDRNPLRRMPERNPMLLDPDCTRGEKNGRWRCDLDTETMIEMRERGLSFAVIAEQCGCSKATVQKRIKDSNHRVVLVEWLNDREDVYCGTVDDPSHRFFVALGENDGVLVANCGEQPLPQYGACLLGSFNLVKYIRLCDDNTCHFDFAQLRADIPFVVRAMDNVIDKTTYPLPQQEDEAKAKRRMGLGVTGLANAIEALGYPYGSGEFVKVEEEVLSLIANAAYAASARLAQEKGAFPMYVAEKYLESPFIKTLDLGVQADIRRFGIRNSHLTSIAPTGTISMCADNVSSGIEPVFAYHQRRKIFMPSGQVETDFDDYGYRVFGVRGRRSKDVTMQEHLAVLACAAHRVDSAVSKTCNVPANTPWQDFKDLYMQSWRLGCKGLTTFQVGGKRAGIVKSMDGEKEASCRIDLKTGRHECE